MNPDEGRDWCLTLAWGKNRAGWPVSAGEKKAVHWISWADYIKTLNKYIKTLKLKRKTRKTRKTGENFSIQAQSDRSP